MRQKFLILIVIVLVIVSFYAWQEAFARHDGTLKVSVLDVGQGDALFAEFPGGFQILIDGGPDATVLSRLSEVMPPRDRSLDLVVSTHQDADHVAGLVEVLKRYDVGRIVETGAHKDTAVSRAWDEAKKTQDAERIVVDKPMRFNIGDAGEFDILWPQKGHDGENIQKPNNIGIVSRLRYGSIAFMLPADIDANVEQALVDQGWDLHAEVLKVAHHGSKTSSFPELLRAVSPKIAVISVGANNRYGHPTEQALDRLLETHAQILRTDKNGTVTIESDGARINVSRPR